MCILALTLFLKIFLGTIYLIKYRCGKSQHALNKDISRKPQNADDTKSIDFQFAQVKQSMYK